MAEQSADDITPGVDEVSPAQQVVLDYIYEHLRDHDAWPTYEDVDFVADQRGVPDALTELQHLDTRLVVGVGGNPSLAHEIRLTLLGLETVASWRPDALADLELFARSVQAAVETSASSAPPEPPRFDGLAFVVAAEGPNPLQATVVRLGLLWSAMGINLCRNLASAGSIGWVAFLDRPEVRKYRKVANVHDLMAIEHQLQRRTHEAAPTVPATARPAPPAASPLAGAHWGWVDLLPTEVRDVVSTRLPANPGDAVLAGWKVLAALIRERTGLTQEGADLVNQAFGSSGQLQIGDGSDSNLHRGYTEMMRGLAHMRNLQAHPGSPELSVSQTAAYLLCIGDCFTAVKESSRRDEH